MRIPISQRIFLATFAAGLLVAIVGLELVRWRMLDNFAAGTRSTGAEWSRLAPLARSLGERHRAAGNWNFVDRGADDKGWLRQALAANDLPAGTDDVVDGRGQAAASRNLGERIALLDADGQRIAGVQPARWLATFASIDTYVRPLREDGRTIGYLQVAAPARTDDDLAVAFLMDQQERLLPLGLLGILSLALASLWLAAWLRKPVRSLVAGARRLEEGRYEARLDETRGDELGELALAFNRLAARLQAGRDEQRRWVADTSHELRTPLAALQAQVEALGDGVRAATPGHLAAMSRQVRGLARIVDDLHLLARADAGVLVLDRTTCEPWPLVEEAVADFADRFRARSLQAALLPPLAHARVAGDPGRLRQVVDNLLENSVRHTDAGGRIAVGARVVAGELHVTFDDSAPGVPVELLPRLGERFFRTDASRSRAAGGSGLGLALSRQLVEAHGGRLEFSASPLGGLRALLVLPLED